MKQDDTEKKQKAGNPIFILIIFVTLFAFLFFIPDIYRKYNSNIAEFLGIGNHEEKPSGNDNPDDGIDAVSEFYQIGSLSTLEYNGLTISDVSLSSDKILTLTFEAEDKIDLEESDYYLEFYQDKSLFLGRRMLKGIVGNTLTLSLDVSNLGVTTASYFNVSHIEESTIRPLNLNSDESGLATMVCTQNGYTYAYDFTLNNLLKVTEKYTYNNSDLNLFSSELLEFRKKEKAYNEYNGITTSLVEDTNSFIFTSEFDYSTIKKFEHIENEYLFQKDMPANVVKFKMEAQGFECTHESV